LYSEVLHLAPFNAKLSSLLTTAPKTPRYPGASRCVILSTSGWDDSRTWLVVLYAGIFELSSMPGPLYYVSTRHNVFYF
jgi:hypothetical protein